MDISEQIIDSKELLSELVQARVAEDRECGLWAQKKPRPYITDEMRQDPALIKLKLFDEDFTSLVRRQREVLEALITRMDSIFTSPLKIPQDQADLVRQLQGSEIHNGTFTAEKDSGDINLVFSGPIRQFVKKNRTLLSKLYVSGVRERWGFFPDELSPEPMRSLMAGEQSKLELLARNFEQGANLFPGLRNGVMAWPFMHLMPIPPTDSWPDFEIPRWAKPDSIVPFQCHVQPLATAETRTWWQLWHGEAAGIDRFQMLAAEAGEIMAKVLLGTSEATEFANKIGVNASRLKRKQYTAVWLHVLHSLRENPVYCDFWNGLGNSESDSSQIELENGLYRYWESGDVFLDSALVCNMLLHTACSGNRLQNHQPSWSKPCSKTDAASRIGISPDKIHSHVKSNPNSVMKLGQKTWIFDMNDPLFASLS